MTTCATVMKDRHRTFLVPGPRPVSRTSAADRFKGNDEPSLLELLADPIFERLLKSDGLTNRQVESVVRTVQDNLAGRRI